jgi:hypothetical protein
MIEFKTSEPIPELGNRTWEELEVARHDDGRLMFRDQIRFRETDGSVKAIDVRASVPRPWQLGKARVECRKLFALLGLDEDRDKDQFNELEQVCILAESIRTFEPKHAQYTDAEDLIRNYDETSLQDVLGRMVAMRQLLEVRDVALTEEEAWAKVAAVASRGHLLPLTDIAGYAQPSLVLFMARQAMKSPTGRAWRQSHGSSTPEPSPEKSSSASSEGQATQTD